MTADNEASIKTFAVLDLETNGLPWEQFNKCSITELSIYAFSAQCLKENVERDLAVLLPQEAIEGIESFAFKPPELPRVLHKLTLMVNPGRMIQPEAERLTGLSNDMLCNESTFDANTAQSVLLFLERLPKPLCFVAHNGWSFDFPVIRHVFDKIKISVPSSIYCIDSLKAFIEIDEKQLQLGKLTESLIETEEDEEEVRAIPLKIEYGKFTAVVDPLQENALIDWQKANEKTPTRKKTTVKRKRNELGDDISSPCQLNPGKRMAVFGVRRELFSEPFQPKSKYPPKGKYKLGNIYERIFNQPSENLHRAETDVMILTKLIIHYGLDFLAYAEERKETFDKVKELGKI